MVHQTRIPGMGTYAARRHHTGMGQRSAPQAGRYVLIPDRLIRDMAHDPLAVGVYVAVARLASAARATVPLAARDLAIWMGRDRDADRVAVMRHIGRTRHADPRIGMNRGDISNPPRRRRKRRWKHGYAPLRPPT